MSGSNLRRGATCWYCVAGSAAFWALVIASLLWLLVPGIGPLDPWVRGAVIVLAVLLIEAIDLGKVKVSIPWLSV